jgi:hypothetical protein
MHPALEGRGFDELFFSLALRNWPFRGHRGPKTVNSAAASSKIFAQQPPFGAMMDNQKASLPAGLSNPDPACGYLGTLINSGGGQ